MSAASLPGMEAPFDRRDELQRAMDEMSDLDLGADGDPALAAWLPRKRPDGLAINWGHKTVLIFDLTCALDSRVDWNILVNQHKTERCPSGIDCRPVSGQVGLLLLAGHPRIISRTSMDCCPVSLGDTLDAPPTQR